jgi:hypothetical protein
MALLAVPGQTFRTEDITLAEFVMRTFPALALAFYLSLYLSLQPAHANPELTGTWRGDIQGQTIVMTVDGKGGGDVDGVPMRYQLVGKLIFIERQGNVIGYSWELRNGQLTVGGGDLPGVLVMQRGAKPDAQTASRGNAQQQPASGVLQELVGKWCEAPSFTANAGGGSQRTTCFELRANGSYLYSSEGSMSANAPGMWGGTSSSSSDAGTWTATPNSITARSQRGTVATYRLEKRNHHKTRDAMLCLDGNCYVTYWQRPRW